MSTTTWTGSRPSDAGRDAATASAQLHDRAIDLRKGQEPDGGGAPASPFRFDVAVLGLGYVGLPTALAFDAARRTVLGVDISDRRLEAIRGGRVDLVKSDRKRLAGVLGAGRWELSGDVQRISEAGLVIISVPTPLDDHLLPDLTALRRACEAVVAQARAGQTIVLTSTTYVGCTVDLLADPLAARGLRAGQEVFVAFSPERIDPGNTRHPHESVPRVVGGVTAACTQRATEALGCCVGRIHPVGSSGAAEMSKLLENTFRAVNIALANEVADVCAQLGLDVMEVIGAAATKPYGFMPFHPGPGVGGHCIPCDPHYLLWQLRARRIDAPVIDQAMRGIAARPRKVVERAREVLATAGWSLDGARVRVLGVTYKPDVEDVRESPALEILEGLAVAGAHVEFVDPLVPEVELPGGRRLRRCEVPEDEAADLVIVHTAHSGVDLGRLSAGSLVLDATYRVGPAPGTVTL